MLSYLQSILFSCRERKDYLNVEYRLACCGIHVNDFPLYKTAGIAVFLAFMLFFFNYDVCSVIFGISEI
jgi:hypothetical protein